MKDPVIAVSKKTGKKVEIPRKRLEKNPHLFELPPKVRAAQSKQSEASKPKNEKDKGGQ